MAGLPYNQGQPIVVQQLQPGQLEQEAAQQASDLAWQEIEIARQRELETMGQAGTLGAGLFGGGAEYGSEGLGGGPTAEEIIAAKQAAQAGLAPGYAALPPAYAAQLNAGGPQAPPQVGPYGYAPGPGGPVPQVAPGVAGGREGSKVGVQEGFKVRGRSPVGGEGRSRDLLTPAYQDRARVAQEQALAEIEENTQRGRAMGAINKRQADMLLQEDQFRQRVAAAAEAQVAQLDADIQGLANMRIDPRRVLRNGSPAGNFFRGLGIIASGLGSRATGGENRGLQMVMQEIDDDIASQRDAISTKQAAIGAKANLYQMNMQRWGNEAQAMAATRAAYLQLGINELEAEMAQKSSPKVIAKYKAGIADMGIALAQEKTKLAEAAKQRAISYAQMNQNAYQFEKKYGLEVAQLQAQGKQAQAKAMQDNLDKAVDQARDPKGRLVVAADQKEKVRLDNVGAVAENLRHLVEQMRSIKKAHPGYLLPGDPAKYQMEGLVSKYIETVNSMRSANAINAHDIEFFGQQIGDPNTFIDQSARWDQAERNVTDYVSTQYRYNTRGFDPQTGQYFRWTNETLPAWGYRPMSEAQLNEGEVALRKAQQQQTVDPAEATLRQYGVEFNPRARSGK